MVGVRNHVAHEYRLRVTAGFSAAHSLRGYEGSCAGPHGHNWKVEVEVEVQALDPIGMGFDFRKLRQLAEDVCGELDHRDLNQVPPFDRENPTAENLSAFVFHRLAQSLAAAEQATPTRLVAVTLWENEGCGVRYAET